MRTLARAFLPCNVQHGRHGTLAGGAMAPYSMDLRKRVARAWDAGCGRRCGRGTVRRQPRVGASADPTAAGDRIARAPEANEVSATRPHRREEERLATLITARPDATLTELRDAFPTTAAPQHAVADDRSLGVYPQKKRYTPTSSVGLMSRRRGVSGGRWQPLRDVRAVCVSR